MFQDLQQAKALQWVAKYIREFVILLLVGANAIQYTNAKTERETYTQFYKQVYETEKQRVSKWEDIVLMQRGSQP